jgi:hypothetical protein
VRERTDAERLPLALRVAAHIRRSGEGGPGDGAAQQSGEARAFPPGNARGSASRPATEIRRGRRLHGQHPPLIARTGLRPA